MELDPGCCTCRMWQLGRGATRKERQGCLLGFLTHWMSNSFSSADGLYTAWFLDSLAPWLQFDCLAVWLDTTSAA